jgi:hypothetical protein
MVPLPLATPAMRTMQIPISSIKLLRQRAVLMIQTVIRTVFSIRDQKSRIWLYRKKFPFFALFSFDLHLSRF